MTLLSPSPAPSSSALSGAALCTPALTAGARLPHSLIGLQAGPRALSARSRTIVAQHHGDMQHGGALADTLQTTGGCIVLDRACRRLWA